jgi:hypothetical protein
MRRARATSVDIATLDIAEGRFTRLLFGEGNQNEPAIAPNGQWMAHIDTASGNGQSEVNIRPWPSVFRTRIPVAPGASPVFSRDGSKLFYLELDGTGISAVDISYEPNISVSAPYRVIEGTRYLWNLFGRTWDPDATGERFLVIRDPVAPAEEFVDDADRTRIDVVLNWFEVLKERVPTQ